MKLITVFSLVKKQIALEMDLVRKAAQYKLTECCQFTTKDDEGKVNKYCKNPDYFFVSNFLYYKIILGSHQYSFCTLSFTAQENNPHSKPWGHIIDSCSPEGIISFLYWYELGFRIRGQDWMLKYLSSNPNRGTSIISMILNKV